MEDNGINILSLFDGISCGQIALGRAGIKVNNYYSSEIDKYAIIVTQYNYPNTIQLGDVKTWRDWNIPFKNIDLILAGFPCQSWSFAGKMGGIEDNRGKLIHQMMDILGYVRDLNPMVKFLFENVKMKKEFQLYVDNIIGCKSIFINSALVSAQSRNRQYWTNIKGISLPEDRNIDLKDILEDNVDGMDVVFDSNSEFVFTGKNGKKIRLNKGVELPYTIYETRTAFGKSERSRIRKLNGTDTTPRSKEHKEYAPLNTKKSNCILTSMNELDNVLDTNLKYRTYTIKELCRLQTIPEDYFDGIVSDNQIRKLIGNGWTVDIIDHLLSFLK